MKYTQIKPFSGTHLTKQQPLISVGLIVLVGIATFFIIQRMAPKRSVSEYCKIYKSEKARLEKLPGDTYPSLLFGHPLSDPGQFAISLGKLERVAPVDIGPNVITLRQLYQKLKDDPSQMASVSLIADSVDNNITQWTVAHCLRE